MKSFIPNERKPLIIAASSVLALGLLAIVFGPMIFHGPPPAMPPMPVTVYTVHDESTDDRTDFMMQLHDDDSVAIVSQIEGRIASVLVHDGQMVHAGQPLFQLDARQQSATVQSLRANASASAEERKVIQESIKAQQADRDAVVADLKFNEGQLARYQKLYATNTVSKKDLEQYETTVKQLNNKLTSLDNTIASQRARLSQNQSAQHRDAQSAESARANLDFYTVKAPVTGRVGQVIAKKGDVISTSTILANVTNNDQLEIEIAVSADYQDRLKLGQTVYLLNAENESVGESQIDFIAPNVDPVSQTVLVKAPLNNLDGSYLSDQKLKARLVWGEAHNLMVPTESVFRVAGQPFVYIAQPLTEKELKKDAHDKPSKKGPPQYKVHMQPVTLGEIQGNAYIITQGLKAGQIIVHMGIQKLQEGITVMQLSLDTQTYCVLTGINQELGASLHVIGLLH